MNYSEFLSKKTHHGGDDGFKPIFIPKQSRDFQSLLIEWAIWKGRGATFADTGLGKTLMQLVWAENVHRHTNMPVLILTPLAVAPQTVREAEKFGIQARYCRDGKVLSTDGIVVANYERLHLFDVSLFGGVVCDESGILKNFDGVRRGEITDFMRKMKYRALFTATAAPNDFTELGTSSEALGELGYMDMLNRFFKNEQNTSDTKGHWINHGNERPKWRFKHHAKDAFWKWVSSWARAIRKPSDFGFDDSAYNLPPLIEREITVRNTTPRPGELFTTPAVGLHEQRVERRITLDERCEALAKTTEGHRCSVLWCHLNDEGKRLRELLPDAVEVSGSDKDESKEEKFEAFEKGEIKRLICKPKIGAWGLNWQHCAHVATFASHSFEQYYQSVRRCWRYGQRRKVTVDIVTTEGEVQVLKNLQRKQRQADEMFTALIQYMNDSTKIARSIPFTKTQETPSWLATSTTSKSQTDGRFTTATASPG